MRNWIFDDKVLYCRVRCWLQAKLQFKTMSAFLTYLNNNLLPSCRVKEEKCTRRAAVLLKSEEGGGDGDGGYDVELAAATLCYGAPRKVCMSTALAWAKRLGLVYLTRKKSYYVDGHDRGDVLAYRNNVYLPQEKELDVRQYLWAQLSVAEFTALEIKTPLEELRAKALLYELDGASGPTTYAQVEET